jgi:hypothetical protein
MLVAPFIRIGNVIGRLSSRGRLDVPCRVQKMKLGHTASIVKNIRLPWITFRIAMRAGELAFLPRVVVPPIS